MPDYNTVLASPDPPGLGERMKRIFEAQGRRRMQFSFWLMFNLSENRVV
jgi:hypothetical protein